MKKWVLIAVAVGSVGMANVTAVHAHAGATGIVKQRMDSMKQMSDAMKALRPLMDQKPLDQAQALPLAKIIQNNSTDIAKMFPTGTDGGTSEALAAVWEQADDFATASQKGAATANALVEAIESGDSAASMKAFARAAKSCKDCHSDFKRSD